MPAPVNQNRAPEFQDNHPILIGTGRFDLHQAMWARDFDSRMLSTSLCA